MKNSCCAPSVWGTDQHTAASFGATYSNALWGKQDGSSIEEISWAPNCRVLPGASITTLKTGATGRFITFRGRSPMDEPPLAPAQGVAVRWCGCRFRPPNPDKPPFHRCRTSPAVKPCESSQRQRLPHSGHRRSFVAGSTCSAVKARLTQRDRFASSRRAWLSTCSISSGSPTSPSGQIGRAPSELQSLAYLVCRLL